MAMACAGSIVNPGGNAFGFVVLKTGGSTSGGGPLAAVALALAGAIARQQERHREEREKRSPHVTVIGTRRLSFTAHDAGGRAKNEPRRPVGRLGHYVAFTGSTTRCSPAEQAPLPAGEQPNVLVPLTLVSENVSVSVGEIAEIV